MEQYVIWSVIENQNGRSVGEIVFDHNHENMDTTSNSLGPKDYRKKEMRLFKAFKITLGLLIFMSVIFRTIRNVAPSFFLGSKTGF